MNKINTKQLLVGGVLLVGTALAKNIIIKLIQKREEDKACYDWLKQYKVENGKPYHQAGFITVDTNRRMIIDGNTGAILEDFNSYPDPENTMINFLKSLQAISSNSN